jgi:hypothetical protein
MPQAWCVTCINVEVGPECNLDSYSASSDGGVRIDFIDVFFKLVWQWGLNLVVCIFRLHRIHHIAFIRLKIKTA